MTRIFATENTSEDRETQKHSYNRPFLDGNVSAALVAIPEISPSRRTNRTTCDTRDQLATVSGWKRVGSTCDTGDQLVSNLLYFATADTSEDRETQKHSYNRPFLDGNVSVALAKPDMNHHFALCHCFDDRLLLDGNKRSYFRDQWTTICDEIAGKGMAKHTMRGMYMHCVRLTPDKTANRDYICRGTCVHTRAQ